MKKHLKNRGGAPEGNQNARKHGYYSKVLTPEQQVKLAQANPDLLQEMKLMMLKMRSIGQHLPDNYNLQFRAAARYNRMFRDYSAVHPEAFSDLDTNRA
jgi:uncharacterized protein YjcR